MDTNVILRYYKNSDYKSLKALYLDKSTFGGIFDKACNALKEKGYKEVIVYSPVGNKNLDKRYKSLGFTKGSNYTAYWKSLN